MKLLGLILLFVSCTAAGLGRAQRLAETVRFWSGFLHFVQYSDSMLRCAAPTTAELVMGYARLHPEFGPAADCARQCRSGVPFPEAWAQSLRSRTLPEDAAALLADFGAGLGASDLIGQLGHLAMYRTLGQEKRDDARAAQQRKARLYVVLGAACGLGLDLLLL